MKTKHIIVLLFLICSQVSFAQHSLFDKYAEMDNVTSVYISKAIFQMMPEMDGVPMNLINKAESLQIVRTEKAEMVSQMRDDFTQLVNKKHEELMRVKDGDTRVVFYADMKGEQIKDLLMFAEEKNGFTVIQFLGEFMLKDIQEITSSSK